MFFQNESRPDNDIQLNPKGKKLKEFDIRFQMSISFVWSIDFKYVNKYIIHSNIHQKLLLKQRMQKIKIGVVKNDGKKIILVIADELLQKSMKNTSTR